METQSFSFYYIDILPEIIDLPSFVEICHYEKIRIKQTYQNQLLKL